MKTRTLALPPHAEVFPAPRSPHAPLRRLATIADAFPKEEG
jgi:hypothetical protein